jgi:predicted transcriptional regulator
LADALGHEVRIEILRLLRRHNLSLSEIVERLPDVPPTKVAYHFKKLLGHGAIGPAGQKRAAKPADQLCAASGWAIDIVNALPEEDGPQ